MARPVKPLNPKTLAALAGAAAVAVLFVLSRPAARADHPPAWWDTGKSDAWADADAAEWSRELGDRTRQVTDRVARKVALVESLVRGERTLDEVATRFREMNGPGRDPYGDLVREFPAAGEEELAYRQVIGFVRMAVRADRSVLRRLEAEVERRFPPAAPGDLSPSA
jgi:hypothetical protein